MQLFYTQNIEGNRALLSSEESRHCLKVLRHKIGDILQITDGQGNFYDAHLIKDNPKNCELEIVKLVRQVPTPPHHIHILIAPTKNIDRTEWFLEKAVELGIQEISFVQCRYSERKHIKLERLERIALSASKQSLQAYLPRINQMQSFDRLIQTNFTEQTQKFIAYLGEDGSPFLAKQILAKQPYVVFIGPEGGFSPEEISLARKHNFQTVSLGKNRYRTETAGIVACHLLNLHNYEDE